MEISWNQGNQSSFMCCCSRTVWLPIDGRMVTPKASKRDMNISFYTNSISDLLHSAMVTHLPYQHSIHSVAPKNRKIEICCAPNYFSSSRVKNWFKEPATISFSCEVAFFKKELLTNHSFFSFTPKASAEHKIETPFQKSVWMRCWHVWLRQLYQGVVLSVRGEIYGTTSLKIWLLLFLYINFSQE